MTRASNPNQKMSDGDNPKEIIEKKYLIREFVKPENWNKISDFKTENKTVETHQNAQYQQALVNFGDIGPNAQVTVAVNESIAQNVDAKEVNLINTLKNNGIPLEDIEELLKILKTDNPNKEKQSFGDNTENWIQKTLRKGWDITKEVAKKVIESAIKSYYGWE